MRKSHENPAVLQTYAEFLTDGPCGHKSHKLLHTTYTARGKYIPQKYGRDQARARRRGDPASAPPPLGITLRSAA